MEDITNHTIQLDIKSLASLKETLPLVMKELGILGLSLDVQKELLHATIARGDGNAEMHAYVDVTSSLMSSPAPPQPVETALQPVETPTPPVETPQPVETTPPVETPKTDEPTVVSVVAVEPSPEALAILSQLVEPRPKIPSRKSIGCYCQ